MTLFAPSLVWFLVWLLILVTIVCGLSAEACAACLNGLGCRDVKQINDDRFMRRPRALPLLSHRRVNCGLLWC